MIDFEINNARNKLVLFIHGFTGDGSATWDAPGDTGFVKLLARDHEITNYLDIASFNYYTKLTNTRSKAANAYQKLRALFPNAIDESKKNNGIDEISELLISEVKYKLRDYDEIVAIAHSMGGLIVKAAIVKNPDEVPPCKIGLFISLAVPHLGANAANLGQFISPNIQIKDLASLSDTITKNNRTWEKIGNKPTVKYFYGTHDDIVTKSSAIDTNSNDEDCIACNKNHTDICKPQSTDDTVFIATTQFIKEWINHQQLKAHLELDDDDQYPGENFVLKLLLAEVHNHTVNHSKELFLNAEYMTRLLNKASDQQKLADLYTKIRELYRDLYSQHLSHGKINSTALVADVHQRIVDKDNDFLRTLLPQLNATHKRGMIHQLANDLSRDIWWSEDTSTEALNQLREEIIGDDGDAA